jgi:hypothetical protein
MKNKETVGSLYRLLGGFHQIGGPWFHLGWPIMFGNNGHAPQARHPTHEYPSSFST